MKKIIANASKNSLLVTTSFCVALNSLVPLEALAADDKFGGITSLMSAAASRDIEGVKFFSKNNPLIINQKNIGGANALHIACRIGDFEIAKVLLERGADINDVDNEGWTPLMRAALSKSKETVNLLVLNGANVAKINSFGESAIMHAAFSDCNECLSDILDRMHHFSDNIILRQQIGEAFVIAQNHDNKNGQQILENALDKLTKFGLKNLANNAANIEKPVVNNNQNIAVANSNQNNLEVSVVEEEMPLITKSNGKIFKFKQEVGIKKATESDDIVIDITRQESNIVKQKNDEVKAQENIKTILQDAEVKEKERVARKFNFVKGLTAQTENKIEENVAVKTAKPVVTKSDDVKKIVNSEPKIAKKFKFSKGKTSPQNNIINEQSESSLFVNKTKEDDEHSLLDKALNDDLAKEEKVNILAEPNIEIESDDENKNKKHWFNWLKFWKNAEDDKNEEIIVLSDKNSENKNYETNSQKEQNQSTETKDEQLPTNDSKQSNNVSKEEIKIFSDENNQNEKSFFSWLKFWKNDLKQNTEVETKISQTSIEENKEQISNTAQEQPKQAKPIKFKFTATDK